jgi:hypothetical protein
MLHIVYISFFHNKIKGYWNNKQLAQSQERTSPQSSLIGNQDASIIYAEIKKTIRFISILPTF